MQPLVHKWTGPTYKSVKLDSLANLIVLRSPWFRNGLVQLIRV